ncbi:transposase, partial [Methylobacterium sp. WL120]|uniref:transposase n=2 Tax=Methylobacterium TaxID=407 RepID=UPI0011CC8D86
KGFVVLERRWVVERTFGWLSHWAGLHRERAGRLDVATGRLACVASLMAANALNNPA